MKSSNLTYEEVWDRLSSIDCSAHTEQKNGLTYLSWAWAWAIMMDTYPDFQVLWLDTDGKGSFTGVEYHPGGTATVHCQVKIGNLTRSMWLPVMKGFKNEAVANPTARDIGDAKMRCMVKCFALFGLGHYIYAGEDLPTDYGTTEAENLVEELKSVGRILKKANIVVPDDLRLQARGAMERMDVTELKASIKQMHELESMK